MVHVPEDAQRRRLNERRRPNGQFGNGPPNTYPDGVLNNSDLVPLDVIANLYADAGDLRDEKADAIVAYIDAAFPSEADFANYETKPGHNHLSLRGVYDDWGDEIPLTGLGHIDDALAELGEPYVDYDALALVNSLDDFGWERQPGAGFSAERLEAATKKRDEVTSEWAAAVNRAQDVAIDMLRRQMGDHIEALELEWDEEHRRMWVSAAIHLNGRAEATSRDTGPWAACNEFTAFIRHPDMAGQLQRSDLTGLYRLERAY